MATKMRACVPLSHASLVRRPLRPENYRAPTTYRKLLLHVAFRLHLRDVEELRFFVRDVVPDKSAADALTVLGLLECLERRKLLGPGQCIFLRTYLQEMGREDLAAILDPLPVNITGCPSSIPRSIHTSLPISLSHTATSLGIVWPFSTYRRSSLEVFRGLTVAEVEQIRWLSQDFLKNAPCWSEEISAVELLRVMETSGLVGPGNYSFLVDCLEEIGRPDLVLLVLPPSLPYLPPSLDIPSLHYQKRIENIQLKKTQYHFGMQNLVLATTQAPLLIASSAVEWHNRMLRTIALKPLLENHSAFILENLPATLTNMSFHLNTLLDGIQECEQNGYTKELAGYISKCDEHHAKLQALMEKAGWDNDKRKRENTSTSRQHHPIRKVSYGAFIGIAEFLLEFSCNKEQFQEESRKLDRVLFHFESLLRLAGYMWSQTSWLIALLQVAVKLPVNLTKHDHLFQELLHKNRHMIRSNNGMLEAVFERTSVGIKFLEIFREKGLISDGSPSDGTSSAALLHVSATPIPLFVFVLLMLSEHPSLAPGDLEEIIASLKEHMSETEDGFCEIYRAVTMMVLNGVAKNIEAFRHLKLPQFGSNSKHGVEEIFQL